MSLEKVTQVILILALGPGFTNLFLQEAAFIHSRLALPAHADLPAGPPQAQPGVLSFLIHG